MPFMKNREYEFSFAEAGWFRVLTLALGCGLVVGVLACSTFAVGYLNAMDVVHASFYLILIFILTACTRVINFFRNTTRLNLIRSSILMAADVTLAILSAFAYRNNLFFVYLGVIYCGALIVSRIIMLLEKHAVRDCVFGLLVIAFNSFIIFILFDMYRHEPIQNVVLLESLLITFTAFIQVIALSLKSLQMKVLFKIIFKTYAVEILFGLITLMMAVSFLLTMYEPEMRTFGDAMWYCFTAVTTIGFGDLKSHTLVGRIGTVVIGIYGVVVVAVLTSIIINFYNEVRGKDDMEQLKKIKIEEDKPKKSKKDK